LPKAWRCIRGEDPWAWRLRLLRISFRLKSVFGSFRLYRIK
jgi:hypothetical protein